MKTLIIVIFSDHDIISLPGVNLNVPCNQDGDGITWLSGINRPTYSWERTDGTTLFGITSPFILYLRRNDNCIIIE